MSFNRNRMTRTEHEAVDMGISSIAFHMHKVRVLLAERLEIAAKTLRADDSMSVTDICLVFGDVRNSVDSADVSLQNAYDAAYRMVEALADAKLP